MSRHEEKPVNEIRFNKHRKRKNNDLVANMYAHYELGKSLAEIGTIYGRTRQAVYDLFHTRGYKLRSKNFQPFVELDGIRFTRRPDGYWRATTGRRIQMHVYVWEKSNGPLPAGHGIHHRDLDRSNNAIDNLECLTIQEISSKHNPHLNQFTAPNGSRRKKGDRRRVLSELRWQRVSRRDAA